MTTLYVDADSGDDTVSVANNTASNAFRTLIRAREETLSAGDTLDVTGIHVDTFNMYDDAIYDLTGAKLVCTNNFTQDEGYSLPMISSFVSQKGGRSFFNDWTASVPFGWTTLGDPLVEDTTNFYIGDRSLYMDSTAQGLKTSMFIPFSNKMNITIGYKNDAVNEIGRIQIKADVAGTDEFWTEAGWTTVNSYIDLPSTTDWSEHTISGIDMPNGPAGIAKIVIIINVPSDSDSINLQSFIADLVPQWSVYSGDTYKMETGTSTGGVFAFKCSTDEWASRNADALVASQIGTDKDSLAAGEFIYDTDHVYYRLDSNEIDISKVHIEAVYQRCIYAITNSGFTVINGELIGGIQGVRIDGAGATGIRLDGTKTHKNQSVGYYLAGNGGEAKWYGGEIYDCLSSAASPKGEGIQCLNGTLYAEGVYVYDIQDDCFQPSGTGVATIVGCLMEKTFGTGTVAEFDIGCTMRNCTLIQSVDGLVVLQDKSPADNDVTVTDCIFIQNSEGNSNIDATIARTTGTRTVDNCFHYGSGSLGDDIKGLGASDYSSGSTNTDALVDVTTGELPSNSPAVGAGTRSWTGANPVGKNGEPFSDFDTDIGANQSTHGPFHPVNL